MVARETWRIFKAKNLKPFFVADSRLALIYRDEAEAILDEAVAMRGTRKAVKYETAPELLETRGAETQRDVGR